MATLVFPSDLRSLPGAQSYPQIEFCVMEDAKPNALSPKMLSSVYLPLPKGISFSDGADLGSVNLGDIIGGGIADAMIKVAAGSLAGGADIGGSLKSTFDQQFNLNSIGTRVVTTLGKIGAEMLGIDEGAVNLIQKKIMAPNKNTSFNGNNLRTFSFAFTLIARSKNDTIQIQAIQRLFRRYVYAGSSANNPNVVLEYPPIWKIRFVQSDGGDYFRENTFMPKIFSCHLKSFTTVINQDQRAYRTDGSPFDMSFTLEFYETRVLTRQDIDNLENIGSAKEGLQNRGIDLKTGLALTAVPIDTTIPVQPRGVARYDSIQYQYKSTDDMPSSNDI